jgi:hypothetical protein
MKLMYRWRYDAAYYRTVIDRYHRQLPILLHLPTQFTLLWLLMVGMSWRVMDIPLTDILRWALPVGAIAIPALVILTKKAIWLKYRVRPSFGSKACFTLSDGGGRIQQQSGESEFPWSIYARAVRFSDGILLLRRGAIRWLPDHSLECGSIEDVLTLVQSKVPLRNLQ